MTDEDFFSLFENKVRQRQPRRHSTRSTSENFDSKHVNSGSFMSISASRLRSKYSAALCPHGGGTGPPPQVLAGAAFPAVCSSGMYNHFANFGPPSPLTQRPAGGGRFVASKHKLTMQQFRGGPSVRHGQQSDGGALARPSKLCSQGERQGS
jgi:hypothetical protein